MTDRTGLRTALLRVAGAILPLSARGLLLSLIAAVLLVTGLARADLASLFWGASFLLYAVYAVAASHVCMLLLRRTRSAQPDFLSVILPQAGMSPGDPGEAHVSARLPRVLAPGFLVRFVLPFSWHERSLLSVACRLGAGRTERSISFRAPERGTYRSSVAVLEVRDVLGFTANRLRLPVAETLVVHPAVTGGQSWRILAEGEEPAAVTRRRRRSEELLEVRKYYPGDDARRLNWKVFAHSRELFLRVGEETPPPESRLLFVLDATENPLIPREVRGEYLDALVESCASAMDALIRDRISVLLCRPGAGDCRTYVLEERAQLLAALADQWWAEEPWLPPLPVDRHLHAAVFSTPGSPGLPPILAQIRNKGWRTSLFLKDPPGMGGLPRLGLRDLLFIPDGVKETGASGQPPASRRGAAGARRLLSSAALLKARTVLNEALARDLATYSGPGWKVRHAREV